MISINFIIPIKLTKVNTFCLKVTFSNEIQMNGLAIVWYLVWMAICAKI